MNYISTIAKYEAKTLFRSWFFKIFAIISILLISFGNLGMFSPIGQNDWSFRAISSFIPHANLLYFNLFQSVIAIFIASDFMKRDKNQDTAQVFYIRPMSNLEYVLGKLFGVLKVFILFNLFIVLLSLAFNLVAQGVGINFQAYLYYILLINIPSLLFILGFSFFLMSLVKNQAITYLILFAYVGGSLFGFGNEQGQIWDYMAFYLPMSYSDIIGFSNLDAILLQRGTYFLLGIFFTALTVLMLNRLPQSKAHGIITCIVGAVAFVLAGLAITTQLDNYYSGIERRTEAIALNDNYFDNPIFEANDYNIDLVHQGHELTVSSTIKGRVKVEENDTVVFALNEGLLVNEVKVDGKTVTYLRRNHLLLIPGDAFKRRRSVVNIAYQGEIDQTLCYLDIEEGRDQRMVGFIRVPQEYAIVDPNFLLLTTESLWYPLAGVTHTTKSPAWETFAFSSYELKVKTTDSLVVVAQGKSKISEDGTYHFKSDKDLPRISVTAGVFEKRTMLVDDVLPINLYHQKGHDYYSVHLDSILDTIPALTAEVLGDFEDNIGLYYPYSEFSVVEVPIQFTAHTHLWAQTTDNTQPMITYIPEKGAGLQMVDFASTKKWNRGNNKKKMTEMEKQVESFKSFLQQTFFKTTARVSSANGEWGKFKGTVSTAYSVFPSFHYFSNHIASREYALLNVVLESYYYTMFGDGRDAMRSAFEGSDEANSASKIFEEMSFEEFLQTDSLKHLFEDAISMKGKYLFSLLESNELDITLDETLEEFLGNTERRMASFEEFSGTIKKNLAVDFVDVWDGWIIDKGIPSFITEEPVYYRFRDEDANLFQVLWKVQNTSETDGVVTFTFRTRRGGSRGGGKGQSSEPETVKALISAGKTFELAMVFDDQPGMMMLDFNVTQNLPSTQMFFTRDFKTRDGISAIEYQKLTNEPIILRDKDEIIVDNEDAGFSKKDQIRGGLIKNWIDREDEEVAYQQGYSGETSAVNWVPFVNTTYYGASIKSAYVVEGHSNGGQTAEWKALLDSSAYYNVYVYIGQPEDRTNRRRPGQGGGQNNNNNNKKERLWNYKVTHPANTDEVVFNLNDATAGWNLLGTYYFENTDTARVELSNLTKEKQVVADAVKWVKE